MYGLVLSTINISHGYVEKPRDFGHARLGVMGPGLSVSGQVCNSAEFRRDQGEVPRARSWGPVRLGRPFIASPLPSRPLLSGCEPGNRFQLHLISRSNILSEIIHVPPLFLTHFLFSS